MTERYRTTRKKRYRQTTKKKEWKEEAIKKVVGQTDRKKL
jgi:hypothetical protein